MTKVRVNVYNYYGIAMSVMMNTMGDIQSENPQLVAPNKYVTFDIEFESSDPATYKAYISADSEEGGILTSTHYVLHPTLPATINQPLVNSMIYIETAPEKITDMSYESKAPIADSGYAIAVDRKYKIKCVKNNVDYPLIFLPADEVYIDLSNYDELCERWDYKFSDNTGSGFNYWIILIIMIIIGLIIVVIPFVIILYSKYYH